MRLIRQRLYNDCGVAAIAMVAGVSYEKALAALPPDIRKRFDPTRRFKTGLSTREVANALEVLGHKSDRRLRPLRKQQLFDIRGRAILCVRFPGSKKTDNWHWVAWCGDEMKMLDPATQLEKYTVHSYIRVWRDA